MIAKNNSKLFTKMGKSIIIKVIDHKSKQRLIRIGICLCLFLTKIIFLKGYMKYM